MKMTFMTFHDGSDIATLIHCTPLWTFDVFLFGPAGVTSHGDSLGPGRPSESIRRFLCLGTAGSICLSLPRQTRTENRQEDCALAAVCDRNVQRAEHVKKIWTVIDHQYSSIGLSFVKMSLILFPWCCNWGRSQICHHELWDIPEAKVITAPWKARHGI